MEWTKDDEQGNTLAYDNTASVFFGAALLTCILIPWTINFLIKFVRPNAQRESLRGPVRSESYCYREQCKCSLCVEKYDRMIKDARLWRNILTFHNIIQMVFLAGFWIINIKLCWSIMSVESLDVGAFNPFEILNVAEEATLKEIKKAYRSLSLIYHPDRNPDDIDAAAVFLRISKAYNALTDETARRNFEKFGNPDGPGNMKVGLGLPKWIVQEENQLFVLGLFFIIILGMVPLGFISLHNKMKKYSASGVRVETLQFLSFYMHDGTRAKLAPEFLAASAEARDIPVRESDADYLTKIEKEIDSLRLYKQSFTMPSVTKNFFLILCHLMRKGQLLDTNLRNDLEKILRASPLVTQSMLELAFVNNWLYTVQSVLEFRRSLLQAQNTLLGDNSAPDEKTAASLLQIPWFTKEHADAVSLYSKDDKKIRSLRELVKSDFEKVLTETLVGSIKPSDKEFSDMIMFLKHVPDIEIKAKIFVDGEKSIVVNDVATCQVKIERLNLKKIEGKGIGNRDRAAGAVHCPYFPCIKFEEWFIFVSEIQSGRIVGYKRVQSTKADVLVPIQFRVEEAGDFEMRVFAMCDSYSGLDTVVTCNMNILKEEEIVREIFIHPEDAAIDEEPNLVQTFMGDLVPESEESESEDLDLNTRKKELSN